MDMNLFSYNRHNKITKDFCLWGSQRLMVHDRTFVSEDNEWSIADCANDLLSSRIISFGSTGGVQRSQGTFVSVLQIAGAFPRNWVKCTVNQ